MRILAIAIAALWSSGEARAEAFWLMHDSGTVDHDLRSRWNEPVRWCGDAIANELTDLMTTVQRVIVVGQTTALVTASGVQRTAHESLVDPVRSYGFWRLGEARTLVVTIACDAPTVCTITASLIVRGGTSTCLERWGTVAYRGGNPK